MKIRCIKEYEYKQISVDDIASVPYGEVLKVDNSGIMKCVRDSEGDFVISLGDDDFYKYFEIIREDGMENKNIVKYEGSELRDKKVERGMIFYTHLGVHIMAEADYDVYRLISLTNGSKINDINYHGSEIQYVDGEYLGYGTIAISDFRK